MLVEKHRDIIDRYGDYNFARRWIDLKQAWLEGRKGDFVRRLAMLALTRPGQTLHRLALSLPNTGVNRAFRRFHATP
jgi:hypothetical protein